MEQVNYMQRVGPYRCNQCAFQTEDGNELTRHHLEFHGVLKPSAKHPAGEPERVSDGFDFLRATVERFQDDSEYGLAYLKECHTDLADNFEELRTLRAQLAEKDASIEKARRDALEEAANVIKYMPPCPFDGPCNLEPTDPCPVCGDRGDDINAPSHCRSPLTVIRALAAQKKEG